MQKRSIFPLTISYYSHKDISGIRLRFSLLFYPTASVLNGLLITNHYGAFTPACNPLYQLHNHNHRKPKPGVGM
ncbi:hypothetical protein XELAEV_18038927mg [Xenopus laevis]|uniref:Uncharacterized protein n=1 Tax=Xenopus laevis TaxID=8355 RepID=A0A974C7P7_XENLA|nr:hypothetical protein XELAEV_18038927mg [Xenopus laevis]